MARLVALVANFGLAFANVKPLRIEGRVAAVFTPYTSDGAVALDVVPEYSKFLTSTGIDTVFVGGTTGESLSLTLPERMALTEAWSKMPQTLIVHVGAESIEDAKALVRHGKKHGAKAFGCMPSVFFKPASVEIIAKWLQAVGAEAPDLPLYYYHIPSMTGVQFMMIDLLKAMDQVSVPSFAGIKYTGLYEPKAFPDFEECMEYDGGKYEILEGREEMTLQALALGTKGFIGSQFNFVGDLYRQIHDAYQANVQAGQAVALQSHALELLDLESSMFPKGANGGKALMKFAGLKMGPARLPSVDADPATEKKYFDAVAGWCTKGQQKFNLTLQMCARHGGAVAANAEQTKAVLV